MRADKSDIDHPIRIVDPNNQAISVATQIKNNAAFTSLGLAQSARSASRYHRSFQNAFRVDTAITRMGPLLSHYGTYSSPLRWGRLAALNWRDSAAEKQPPVNVADGSRLGERVDTLSLDKIQEFQGRTARPLIADLPLLHRRLACVLPMQASAPVILTDAGFRGTWFALVKAQGWDWVGRIRKREYVCRVTPGRQDVADKKSTR